MSIHARSMNISAFTLLFTFFLSSHQRYAQYYTSHINADSAYEAENYPLAISLYKKKLATNDQYVRMFGNTYKSSLACAYSKLKLIDSAFYFLFVVVEDNYSYNSDLLVEHDLSILHKDPRWKKIESKIKLAYYKESQAKDKELGYELYKMYGTDQQYRSKAELYKKKNAPKQQIDSLWVLQGLVDSINLRRLEEIISLHGWPGRTLVGMEGSTNSFLIIQHANLTTQKKYLPLIKDAAQKGEIRLGALAYLEDRILVREGKMQRYGTQLHYTKEGKAELDPIEDEKNVDARRAAMGLEPIKEYVKIWGIEYVPPK
jgi:hypothetical protein